MIVNHPNAILTQSAQDLLLQWIYARVPMAVGPQLPAPLPMLPVTP
jgi:hypothetical protein